MTVTFNPTLDICYTYSAEEYDRSSIRLSSSECSSNDLSLMLYHVDKNFPYQSYQSIDDIKRLYNIIVDMKNISIQSKLKQLKN